MISTFSSITLILHLLFQPMPAQELWQWVHLSYGEDLGLTSSDDDYVQPSPEEENMNKANSDERIAIKVRFD